VSPLYYGYNARHLKGDLLPINVFSVLRCKAFLLVVCERCRDWVGMLSLTASWFYDKASLVKRTENSGFDTSSSFVKERMWWIIGRKHCGR